MQIQGPERGDPPGFEWNSSWALKFARLCDGRTFDPETGRWFELMLFSYFSFFPIDFRWFRWCPMMLRSWPTKHERDFWWRVIDVNQDSDYVSMVNKHLQVTRRPRSGQSVAQYRTISATAPFRIEIQIEQRVWQGLPQSKIKLAKQSAAYEAWKTLRGMTFSQSRNGEESWRVIVTTPTVSAQMVDVGQLSFWMSFYEFLCDLAGPRICPAFFLWTKNRPRNRYKVAHPRSVMKTRWSRWYMP